MANLMHRHVLQSCIGCPLRLGKQLNLRAPGVAYGRPCNQAGNRRLGVNRTKAQDRPEHAASSAPAATEKAESATPTSTSAGDTGAQASGSPGGESFAAVRDGPNSTTTNTTTNSSSTSTSANTNTTSNSSSSATEEEPSSPLDLATASTFIEKTAGALLTYGLTVLLANLSGVDATADLQWAGGAPLSLGALAALPACLGIGLLFLPSLDLGFTQQELSAVGKVDREMEEEALTVFSLGKDESASQPPFTPEALKQGLWLYQMNVLKPWFPSFQWTSVGMLYLASCTASSAQELLVRGYGGSLLVGWYNGVLAGTTDVNNPIYWAKVFKLVTPETSRWLAALSLIALQVALSSSSASRAARFAHDALSRTGRATAQPGVRGMMVQNLTLNLDLGPVSLGLGPQAQQLVQQRQGGADGDSVPGVGKPPTGAEGAKAVAGVATLLAPTPPTAEERLVYWAYMGVSLLLCGSTNLAWAASGSLLASFTAQVVIDGVVTVLQQAKATRLPDKELWEAVRKEEEDSDSASSSSDSEDP